MIDAFLGTLAFALGACVGSFLNVCIGRWPHNESVVSPRSRCPRCAHEIAWYDNIPMVSWILLRAKCRGCALPISAQYPIVELVVGILWLLAAVHYGATFAALRVAIFATIMLGIAVTDAKHYLIPDGFTVSGLVFVMVTSMVAVFRGEPGPFAEPYDALVGACAGAGAVAIVGWLGEVVLKKEAMGFGDVTLMAVVGAAVGPTRSLLVLFIGAALGAFAFIGVVYPVVKLRGAPRGDQIDLGLEAPRAELPEVPFGVFLAPAAILVLVWGETLIAWYSSQFLGM
ncbi:MAG TPA: prepilin peptidase [Gemmatimonadaceae bacterium]|mgnify:FL=1|nr:prepilin peptidase [Gemmatimonadota bacterium]HPV77972.1 prepilin peptidase [Gemmatimonadaceae bacterium]